MMDNHPPYHHHHPHHHDLRQPNLSHLHQQSSRRSSTTASSSPSIPPPRYRLSATPPVLRWPDSSSRSPLMAPVPRVPRLIEPTSRGRIHSLVASLGMCSSRLPLPGHQRAS